jgi:TolB protein
MDRSPKLSMLLSTLAVLGCGQGRAVQPGTGDGGPTITPGSCDLSVATPPWFAFSSRRAGNYDVYVEREDGSCLRAITTDAGNDLYAAWAPDRQTLAFASDRGSALRVFVHDFATGTEVPLDVGALSSTSPAYSPDGSTLAFEGRTAGAVTSDIYLVPASGGTPVNLTNDPSANAGPAWSLDGSTVFFVSNRTGPYDVYAVTRGGGPAQAVTTHSRIVGKPAVSPDGTSLAYARTVSGSSTTEVVAYVLATGALRVVTSENDSEPTFSPSGAELVVRSYRTGNPELFLVDLASGAELRQLTDDPASDGAVAFAPPR